MIITCFALETETLSLLNIRKKVSQQFFSKKRVLKSPTWGKVLRKDPKNGTQVTVTIGLLKISITPLKNGLF